MKIFAVFIFLLVISCNSYKVPKEKLSQFSLQKTDISHTITNDSIKFYFKNPLHCPIRIFVNSENKTISQNLKNPYLLLPALKDTTVSFKYATAKDTVISYDIKLGDPKKQIVDAPIALPIKQNSRVRIIQGNNSSYSHNKEFSRFAIDFALKERDTIYAATSGFITGLIKDYKYGGAQKKWKGYDNFITLYDPDSGRFTQYAHLVYNGVFVEVGEQIKQGQPIGLAGTTGYTDVEHLHFNTLKPVEGKDLISIPVQFKGGYKSIDLKKNDYVIKK